MTIGKEKVNIGEPGSVHWNAPDPPFGYTTKSRAMQPYRELWWGTGFQPLFQAYMVTKNEAYLKRWLGYMDDWSLNCTFLMELHPIFSHDNCSYPVVTTVKMLAGIANALPWDSETVSPRILAQILRRLATESILNDVVYMRANPNAWTPGAGRMLFAMMIDEFKVAPLYFRETRRRNIEDINVLQGMLDGTESHQWPGYNPLLMLNMGAIRLIEARESMPNWAWPSWKRDLHTAAWQRELKEYLGRRASYLIHLTTPQGEYPLVTHHEPPWGTKDKAHDAYTQLPEALDDLTNAKIVSTVWGNGMAGEPAYNSEWFPYGGYSIVRDGWGKDDGHGSFFCSPKPGCGSVGAVTKNNSFCVAAYGMDLLYDDTVHGYVRPTSPIQVDKKRQCFDFNVYTTSWPSGHRGQGVSAWTEPSPWRWHASDSFNLIEGVYSGVYSNNARDRKDFIDDIAHQRLAMYARGAGLWIITDRIQTAKKHDYEQLWWLPVKKKKEFGGFKPEEIVIDGLARTIKTTRTGTDTWWSWDRLANISVGNVNLSMYQFADAPLKYTSTTSKSGEEMYDFQRIGVSWAGEGTQQIVTAIFPRKPTPEKKQPDGTENDLKEIKPIQAGGQITGFVATTAGGIRVTYLAAANQSGLLQANGVKVTAEALLISDCGAGVAPAAGNAGGTPAPQLQGMVLGCKAMSIGGKAVAVPQADFEFSIPASSDLSKVRIDPIYRPISPVKILPESDVFAGEAEIMLKSDTPGVSIHYTLDGTDPTPQSTLYQKPFKIDRTLTVKTRAYRPGVLANPPHTSGTHATAMTFGVFTRKLPYAANADVSKAAPGLQYAYYEGFWKDMWLSLDKLTPARTGNVPELFDLSPIPADNAQLTDKLAPRQKTYALKYTGYLKVPEDGVYTLHAPREYVYPDNVAGYELQVYLGHATILDAGQPRREGDLSYWYPATRLHGLGTWSAPLKKGYHEFKVVYIDFRMDGPTRLNRSGGIREYVWSGEKPALLISGPGIEKQPIPADWLWR